MALCLRLNSSMQWENLSVDKLCRFSTGLRNIGALYWLMVTEDSRTQRREVILFTGEKKTKGSIVLQAQSQCQSKHNLNVSKPVWSFPGTKRTSLHQGGRTGRAEAVVMLIRQCRAVLMHILTWNHVSYLLHIFHLLQTNFNVTEDISSKLFHSRVESSDPEFPTATCRNMWLSHSSSLCFERKAMPNFIQGWYNNSNFIHY